MAPLTGSRRGRVLVRGALAALLLAPAAVAAKSTGTRVVTIRGIDFHPRSVVIRRGGSVTWHFVDPGVSHNVTSRGRPHFHSSATQLTGSYTVTFKRSGTYHYLCTIHPNMHATVVVR